MRRWWFVVLVFVVAIAFGCGQAKDDKAGGDTKAGAEKAGGEKAVETTAGSSGGSTAAAGGSGGSTAAAGGVKAAVHEMMDAFKKGDPDPFLKHMDLEGVYQVLLTEEQRAQTSLEDFKTQMREGMLQAGAPPEGFDYKIVGTKPQGDTMIVTMSVKESAESDWAESEVEFKKMDGIWKITGEGFKKMMEN
jgi:hypothetical protein